MRMPLPCAMSMRRLVGWESIRYELAQYIEKQVQARCFEVGEEEDCFSSYPPCTYGRSCVQRTWMMRGCSLRAVRYPSLHPAMERHARSLCCVRLGAGGMYSGLSGAGRLRMAAARSSRQPPHSCGSGMSKYFAEKGPRK